MAKTWYGTKIECGKSLWMSLLLLFSCWVLFESLCPHGLQHSRLLCPLLTPRVCSHSCPLSWWCHPTILFSVVPFSSCLQSFPASGSFPLSQFFISGGQSIGASVSVLPLSVQDWFPLGLTGLMSLQSKVAFCQTLLKHYPWAGMRHVFLRGCPMPSISEVVLRSLG